MKKLNTEAVINTALFVGLTLGIAVILFVSVFTKIDNSGYVAQIAEPAKESDEVPEQVVSAPIVQEVTVSSAGAYTMDGRELYSFRSDKRWPIASITKLMTALVADDLFDPEDIVVITEEMIVGEGESGGFVVGESVSVEDLLDAMLLISSNDAASAIAIHYGEDAFVEQMNQLASDIGMAGTSYVDPTGLSVQNLSTVEDLRKLTKHIWETEPYIFKITQRETSIIVSLPTGFSRSITNINEFVGRGDFLGGKTGTIPEADQNLVSLFEVPGRAEPVIIIVLGATDRFQETRNILVDL